MDMDRIPAHVAIVMDGNGRWAKKNGKSRISGHDAGMKAMKEIVKRSDQLGVKYLTVYAFSTENWKRSAEEVSGIFGLVVKYVNLELAELNRNNVAVRVLGDYTALPKRSIVALEKALHETNDNTGLKFNIALNYGSRQEMLEASKKLARIYAESESSESAPFDLESFTEQDFADLLETKEIPDPDVLIRTSGEMRLSNFLLWQSAYSELVFTDVLWPDFSPEEFDRCIEEYQGRARRFGGR
jgi:undecaprenyl diphosphate synthase